MANDSISNERAKCSTNIHEKVKRIWFKPKEQGDPAKTKRVYEYKTEWRKEEQPHNPLFVTYFFL